eukprot:TRINITY_DN8408_c0_g1_i1.p1 TRINITY_DN8408_c0_g1~~TRINITY_DN8408_c0_g1_i1.p1  ORF type:complete len:803 (-),score=137.90 TRINITY_DN8408_c0_g1_i1:35-2395(-)
MAGRGQTGSGRYTNQGISYPGMPAGYPQYPNNQVPQYPVGGRTWDQAALGVPTPNNSSDRYTNQPGYAPTYTPNNYPQAMTGPGYNMPAIQPNLPAYQGYNNGNFPPPQKTQPQQNRQPSPNYPARTNPQQQPTAGRSNPRIGNNRKKPDFTASKKKRALKQMGNANFMNTIQLNKMMNNQNSLIEEAQNKHRQPQKQRQPQQQRQPQPAATSPADARLREQIRKEEENRMRAEEQKRRAQDEKLIAEERARLQKKMQQDEMMRQKETEEMRAQLEAYKKELELKNAQNMTPPFSPIIAGERQKHVWEINPKDVEITRELGKGAFGVVYAGRLHGKEVAIKKLFMQDTEEDLMLDFKNEVQVMNNLRHPNILLLMGASFEHGNLMIITELMPGGSVDDLIHKPKPGRELSFAQRMKIARDSALGMNWLHRLKPPFLHLDLKSANLLVNIPIVDQNNLDFVVKVADFGLTQMKTQSADGMVGSPFYMAPEMLLEKEYDEKVDVYSFSIVLWELFTCKEPYKDMFSDLEELIEAITLDIERPALPADTPAGLKALLTRCWDNDPAIRPTFESIIDDRSIEKIIIEYEIKDPRGAKLWQSQFLDKFYMYWDDFWKGFSAEFNCLFSDTDAKVKVFQELVVDKATKRVTMRTLNECLAFFGPLKDGNSFLDNIDRIAQREWFFGPLTTGDAEKLLRNSKKKGTFLVRFSSRVGNYSVSVAYKSGKVRHLRVTRTPDGKYSFDGKTYQTLSGFLASSQKSLGLRAVCPGSPFVNIYSPSSASSEYLYGNYM